MKFGSVSIFASVSLGVYVLLGCGQIEDQREPVRSSQAQSSNYQSAGLIGDKALKIISDSCVSCHGAGSALDLTDTNVIKQKAPMIESQILDGTMPPSSPLAAEQMLTIDEWAKAGYPLGGEAPTSGSKDPGSKDPGDKGGKPQPTPVPTPKPTPKPDHPGQSDCTSQSKCEDHPSQGDLPEKK